MTKPLTEAPAFSRRAFALELLAREAGEEKPEDANRIRVVASTDVEYDWGYAKEKLVHDDKSIDRSGAFSALFNHDVNQVIGKIVKTEIKSGRMVAELEIDPEARGSNGIGILKAIKSGYVKGVSIGYDYSRADVVITEDDSGKRTLTVNRWTLREISITPTPADLEAQVGRSVRSWFPEAPAAGKKELDMNFEAWLKARGLDASTLSKEQLETFKKDFEAAQRGGDELKIEREKREKAEREAAAAKHRADMHTLARSHKIELTDAEIEGKTAEQVKDLLLERKAKADKPEGSTVVDVTLDAADKADAAAEDALLAMVPGMKAEKDLGMRKHSALDIGRAWMLARGFREAAGLSRREMAESLLGKSRTAGRRDAANITSGMYTSYLLANVMDKAVNKGFGDYAKNVTYPLWTGERTVSDFKQFTGAALDAGNLVETTENIAFPELSKAETGYNGTLKLWGATHSLTLRALVNDDLGEFMAQLARAGAIAQRTIDKEVYAQLVAASWTGRARSSAALSDDNLSLVRGDMQVLTGPSGEILGHTARFLLVPPALRAKALAISQVASYVAPSDVKVNADIQPIISPFLPEVTTKTNSLYYVAADPAVADTVKVCKLAGMEAPAVEEYDAGAVAARKWKIMLPFCVVVPTIYAMYRGGA